MINYTNPNSKLLESFFEDWPEPTEEVDYDPTTVEEEIAVKECNTPVVEAKEEDPAEDPIEEVADEAEEKSLEDIKAAAEDLLHKDDDGNVIEDDEFNQGINAVLALFEPEEETEEEAEEEVEESLTEAKKDKDNAVYIIYTEYANGKTTGQEKTGVKPADLRDICSDIMKANDVEAVYVAEKKGNDEIPLDKYTLEKHQLSADKVKF